MNNNLTNNLTINKDKTDKSRIKIAILFLLFVMFYLSPVAIFSFIDNDNVRKVIATSFLAINIFVSIVSLKEFFSCILISNINKRILYYVINGIYFLLPTFLYDFRLLDIFGFIPKSIIQWYMPILILLVYLFSIIFYILKLNVKRNEKICLFVVTIFIVFGLKSFYSISFSRLDDSTDVTIFYGFWTIVIIWSTIMLTDTLAYLFGKRFGKIKLAPNISPNKTLEGALYSFIVTTIIMCSITIGTLYVNIPHITFLYSYSLILSKTKMIILYILTIIIISSCSQIGDLLFSFIKRQLDIKDFSNKLKSHGGILDRLDSFYFVFTVLLLIFYILNNNYVLSYF